MKKSVLAMMLFACVEAVSAQPALPPPFPRTNATQLLDPDRITVWDIVWPKGQPTAMHGIRTTRSARTTPPEAG